MRRIIGFIFTVTLLTTCNNSKKQHLESTETKEPETKLEVLYDSEAILDTLVSPQGIMYKESNTFANYPQWTWVDNSILGSLPFYLEDMKGYNNLLYTGYTRDYLSRILKNKCFTSFRSDQKKKIKSYFDNMNENEYLVMLFK